MAGVDSPRRAGLSLSFLKGGRRNAHRQGHCPTGVYRPTTTPTPTPTAEEQQARLLPTPGEGDNSGIPSLKPGVDYINPNGEEQAEVYGYKRAWLRTSITWILILATAGLLRLVFHWIPKWMLQCTHIRCSLEDASKVLVVEVKYNRSFVKNVYEIHAQNISLLPRASDSSVWKRLQNLLYFLIDARYFLSYPLICPSPALPPSSIITRA